MDSRFGRVKRSSSVLIAVLAASAFGPSVDAQQLQQARVTHVVNDVKLLPSQAAPRPAVVNDEVKVGTAVRTGTDSRSELTFTDLTITRLGANTVFSFKPGTRELKLNSGAILISVPPNAPEVKVSTSAVSAAISGGTCILDATTGKFMVFEGIGRIWPIGHPELAVIVPAGSMVWLTADGKISAIETFNVRLATETGLLFTGFPQQLPNWPYIVQVFEAQGTSQYPPLPPNKTDQDIASERNDASPTASPTPSPTATETPPPTPTPTPATPTPTPTPEETPTPTPATPTPTPTPEETPTPTPATPTPTPTPEETPTPTPATPTPTPTPATPTPTPTPATPTPTPATPTPTPTPATPTPTPTATPSEFGPPQTITSPNPYVINGNTVIFTDPTITTNGQTDFGTIYRGPGVDGPFSTFAFGSTSSFDTSSGFDAQIDDTGALFKFTALQLAGNPTVNTTNGPTSLALIGVNSITSAAPGGALTFTGLNGLLLATVNGPIAFGSEVSFSGFNDLTMYARGATSDLTLGSSINVARNLHLYAERDINITSSVRAPMMSFVAGRDLTFTTFANSETITETNGNVSLRAGNDITSAQQIQIGRLNGGISSGLNVTLDAGNDLNVGTNLLLSVNNSESMLTSGGNIAVMTGNDVTVGGLFDAELINSNDGNRSDEAVINLAISGNLTAQTGGLILHILNNDGGFINGRAAIFIGTGGDLNAASVDLLVNNRNNGLIDEHAEIASNILGAFNTTGDATIGISNRNDGAGGGSIQNDANINIQASSISVGGFLTGFLSTNAGGQIGTDAAMQFGTAGDLHSGSGTFFTIESTGYNSLEGPFIATGQIGDNATITVNAGSLSSGGFIEADIFNRGGQIGESALTTFTIGGDITAANEFVFNIGTADNPGGTAGDIGSSAKINLSAGNVTADSFSAFVSNQGGGGIGDDAQIQLLTGVISTAHGFTAIVDNTNGGGIGNNAGINIGNAGLIGAMDNSADTYIAINNYAGGNIGGTATISLGTEGDFAHQGNLFVQLLNGFNSSNAPGGHIGDLASIDVLANNIFAANDLLVSLDNAGGMIDGGASVNLFTAGNITAGNVNLRIYNFDDGGSGPGSIGQNATVGLTTGGDLTTGLLTGYIGNFNGGHIVGSATVNFAAGNITTTGDFALTIDNSLNGRIDSSALIFVSSPIPDEVRGATMSAAVFGNINIAGAAVFQILNLGNSDFLNGGLIQGNAGINIDAVNFTADSLQVGINSSHGGGIDGSVSITSRVGTLTTTNDATYRIDLTPPTARSASPSSPAVTAADIDFLGGAYEVGGTFLVGITGEDGQINFTNGATVHADVIKVGAFADNGVLRISGGMLSADTTLKLYAGGSNGTINFVADVSLNGNSAKTLAANTINIFDGVTLTINGPVPANLYTNNPNFASSSGGNDVHSGVINGTAGHEIHPFDANTPPFDDPARPANAPSTASATTNASPTPSQTSVAASGSNGTGRRGPKPPVLTAGAGDKAGTAVNVADTNQIVQMLEDPAAGSGASTDRPSSPGKQKNSRNRGRKSRPAAEREPRMNHSRIDRGRLPAP